MTESDDLRSRAAECIASVFGLDARDVLEEAEFSRLDGWDSLRHLQMMVELEKEFGCAFAVDDIVSVGSLDDVVALLRGKKT